MMGKILSGLIVALFYVSAFAADYHPPIDLTGSLTGAASLNVLKTGDTMTGDLTMSGSSITAQALGSNDVPSYSFDGDEDTGIYAPVANVLSLVTQSEDRLYREDAGGITLTWWTDAGLDAL